MATLANVVRVSVAVAGLVSAVGLASTHAANSELKRERASAGSVLAELSYRQVSDPYLRVYDLRLRVWRSSRLALDERIQTDPDWEFPARAGDRASSSLFVVDLSRDREPEVLVTTYHPGTGCPYVTRLWHYLAVQQRYLRERLAELDLPPRHRRLGTALRDVDGDGTPEFLSLDCRFYGLVVPGAESAFPIRILHWQAGGLVDVTRDFPAQVRADAAAHLRAAQAGSEASGGAHAAYLADMYLLGLSDAGWQVVLRTWRRGELPARSWRGRPYLRELCTQLVRLGYATSRATCPSVARPTTEAAPIGGGRIYIYSGCEEKLVYKPRRFGCPADYVTNLVWTKWGPDEAIAQGTFVTSGAGTSLRFRAQVRASGVRTCSVRVRKAGGEVRVRARVFNRTRAYLIDRGHEVFLPGPPPCE